MAEVTDLQRLIVSFEANIKKYERELNKANGVAQRRAAQINSTFGRMNRQLEAQFAGLGRGLVAAFAGAAAIRGAQQIVDAAIRIENALKVAGLSGDELTKVYDRLFASAQRNAAPIESLVELYSRAALVQNELNVSTEELLRFTDRVAVALRVSGKSASEASGALLQLSQALGSGVVRAEEFNSILEGALPIAQAAAAGLEEAGGSVAKLRKLVIDGKVSSEAFFRAFEAGASVLDQKVANAELTLSQSFIRLQNVLVDAASKIDRVSGVSGELVKIMTRLSALVQLLGDNATTLGAFFEKLANYGERAIPGLTTVKMLLEQIGKLLDADPKAAATAALGEALAGRNGGAGNTVAGVATNSRIDQAFSQFSRKPVTLSDYPVTGGKAGRENSFEREIRQMQERTKYLDLERELVAATNLERDKALATQELENAALQAKIPLNETIRQQIEQTAEAYAMAAEKAREATDKQQAIIELQQEFGNMAASSIKGLIDGTKSLNDVLQDVLSTLADLFIQSALLGQGPLASLFGTGAKGGGVGGIIGALFGGGRASGGPVSGNRAYVVGERGPELFYPGRSGTITPNKAISGGVGGTVVNVINNASGVQATQNKRRGPDGRDIVEIVVAEVGRKIGEGGYDKQLDGRYGVAPRRVAR
ncbi:MAG: tape measure protein [Flavobacteriaceae bacterium]